MAKVVPIELYKQADFTLVDLAVRPSLNRVEGRGKTIRLEPKVMKVLVVLWRADGAVVSRDDLIEDVWEGQIVTDDAITRCISRLRRLFSEDFPGRIEIETVQKTGYRLTAAKKIADKRAPKIIGAVLVLAIIFASAWIYSLDRATDPLRPEHAINAVQNRPFTSLPGFERNPDFSPDGLYVAFSWQSPETGHYDLYRMDVTGEGRLQLTDNLGDERWPVWSPDGTQIAFVQYAEDTCSIRLMPSIGGPEHRIGSCGQGTVTALDWASDGSMLLVAWREKAFSRSRLYLINPATAEEQELEVLEQAALGVDDAVFSPDGGEIAFTLSPTLGVEDIYIMPTAGGPASRVTNRNLKVHGLEWARENEILASTNWLGTFGLWAVPIDDGPMDDSAPRAIRSATTGVDGISISPSGDVMIEEWTEQADVWKLYPEATTWEPLALNSTRYDWDARPSPNREKYAFVSDRGGSAELWVYDETSDTFDKLTSFGGPWTHSPRWSPDGRYIAFTSPVDGRFDLFLADIETGQITQLTSQTGNNFAPAWSPDGQYIYYGTDRTGNWTIHKLDVATATDTALDNVHGRAPQVSPDGQWLYYTRIDEDGLWRRLIDTDGEEEKILEDLVPVDWNNWQAMGEAIYYIRRRIPDQPELVRYSLTDGSYQVLVVIPDLLHNSGLWMAPDSSYVLITRIEDNNADLVLLGNGDY